MKNDFSHHMQNFFRYIILERGFSHNTKDNYIRDLNKFVDFLNYKRICSFTSVETSHVVEFLNSLKNLSDKSRNRALFAIKSFFKFLRKEEIININVVSSLPHAKTWQRVPEILSIEEIELILSLPDVKTCKGARNLVILELLFGSGLRVSEVCNLKIKNFSNGFVQVVGKGNKERVVPISEESKRTLDYYLENFNKNTTPNSYVFPLKSSKPIDRVTVWRMIKEYAKEAKINKNIHPHTFRHSFATHLLRGKADLRVVQDLLGHSDIGSTGIYLTLCTEDLSKAFINAHPRYHGSLTKQAQVIKKPRRSKEITKKYHVWIQRVQTVVYEIEDKSEKDAVETVEMALYISENDIERYIVDAYDPQYNTLGYGSLADAI